MVWAAVGCWSRYPMANSPGSISKVDVYSDGAWAQPTSLPVGTNAIGALVSLDVDGDGDLDVWVGGRSRTARYPESVPSQWWLNEKGRLVLDAGRSAPFEAIGMPTGACAVDLDRDGDGDLVVATEWGPVRIFINDGRSFREATEAWGMASLPGLWSGVATGDFNGDGLPDLVCGNWGRNSQYEWNQPTDLRLYYGDWAGDGVIQILEAWRSGSDWWPVHDRSWLSQGIPKIASEFKSHAEFSRATIPAILMRLGAPRHPGSAPRSCLPWFSSIGVPVLTRCPCRWRHRGHQCFRFMWATWMAMGCRTCFVPRTSSEPPLI